MANAVRVRDARAARGRLNWRPASRPSSTSSPTALDGTLRMTISPASGFTPAELTPGNRDRRFLGCWVEVVG
ncbi:MAG: hypothetical protein M0C28_16395 [Candidatus Moduliflexus flocculans]|nr:hypothetical protein [Candidatus Moduliflexus flocculans]